jgi:hypothetical protein
MFSLMSLGQEYGDFWRFGMDFGGELEKLLLVRAAKAVDQLQARH